MDEIIIEKDFDRGAIEIEERIVQPKLKKLKVVPSANKQYFKPNKYGFSEVEVEAVPTEQITITPSLKEQIKEGLFNKVTVEAYNDETLASLISLIDETGGTQCFKLPNDITKIGDYAFYNKKNLALTELPESVTEIGDYAFCSCTNLKLKKLPDKLEKIGPSALRSCTNWTIDKLPENLTTTSSQAFEDSTSLNLAILPEKFVNIGSSTFSGCTNLALKKLPIKLKKIESSTFEDCTNLLLTQLPENLTGISSKAFYKCKNIVITSIPKGVKYLDTYVFEGCTKLETIDFKGDVYQVTGRHFYGCSNLKTVVFSGVTKVPGISTSEAFSNTPIINGNGNIYFPDDLVESVKIATNWSSLADVIMPISKAPLFSIEIDCDIRAINLYNNEKIIQINGITYNNGHKLPNYDEEIGYTLSIEGNAILSSNNLIIVNEEAKDGDIITVTVTSTYDKRIKSYMEIQVYDRKPIYSIDLNDGEWIDSGTTINENVVYKSDAGTYGIEKTSCASVARIHVDGCKTLKIYIRSYADGYSAYTNVYREDAAYGVGGNNAIYRTYNKQSPTDYIECIYELDYDTHFIDVAYTKTYNARNVNDDRGYFYIGECI